jgi:hypothetical protein
MSQNSTLLGISFFLIKTAQKVRGFEMVNFREALRLLLRSCNPYYSTIF